MSPTPTAPPVEELLLKARAYGLCARLLSVGESAARVNRAARDLAEVLSQLGLGHGALPEVLATGHGPGYLKPLKRGEISPYETRYETTAGSSGGMTFQLADIAGFYRAFGFEVSGERPDHIVPELEFVALLYAKEAYAWASGDEEGKDVCAEARRKFIAEHLGVWLPQFARRIAEQDASSPLSTIVGNLQTMAGAERN